MFMRPPAPRPPAGWLSSSAGLVPPGEQATSAIPSSAHVILRGELFASDATVAGLKRAAP
jgi:hypothetical protein